MSRSVPRPGHVGPRRAATGIRRPVLQLEWLEDRRTPTTFTWSGLGANDNWSTTANWVGGSAPTGAPSEVDDLVFPAGVMNTTAENDLAGATVNSITITGTSSPGYDLAGNAITLGVPGAPQAGAIGIGGLSVNNVLAIDTELGLAAGSVQFFTVSSSGKLTITGQLSGNTGSSLSKEGAGLLVLSADNSGFTGPITVDNNSGTLEITNANALGSSFSGTTVDTGSTLELDDVAGPVDGGLRLNGQGVSGEGALFDQSGSSTWAGPITLDSDSYLGAAAGTTLTITGPVGDTGSGHALNKEGAGEIQLAGRDTYRGPTTVDDGVLTDLDGPGGPAVPGSVVLDGAAATFRGSGVVGTIDGGGGNPAVGTISPGVDTAADPAGILSSSGAAVWGPRTTFSVYVADPSGAHPAPTAGGDYSRFNVAGNIALGGATLGGRVGPGVQAGDRFTIVQATGGTVSGTFADTPGLPAGVVAFDGQEFQVDYSDPTRVVIEKIRVDTTTTLTSSANPAGLGRPVTFTASVTPAAGGPIPVGDQVQFTIDGGTPVLVDVTSVGVATYTTASLPAGAHTVTAVFEGDDLNFAPSPAVTLSPTQEVVEPPAPVVTAVSPAGGPVAGGTTVTITGTDLGDATVVDFGGAAGTIVSDSATQLVVISPPGNARTVTITVTTPGGTATAAFTYAAASPVTTPVLVGYPQFAVGSDAGGPATVTLYAADGSAAATFDPFPGTTDGVRTAAADFLGDGTTAVAAGTGPGTTAEVKVVDPATGAVLFDVKPFGDFTGGVFVAAGDVTGDGKADLVVTPDLSGGPRVEVYEGGDFREIANFMGIDDPNFRGGARAALGDVNGDGAADLVLSAGFGGGPRVSVYDGRSLAAGQEVHLVPDFFLFEPTLRNGAYVAVGDVNGDGFADVIGGGGPGGGPRVLVISGKTLVSAGAAAALAAPVANFYAGDTADRGGVRVAVKDLDGDPYADVVTGDGTGDGSTVAAYPGKDLAAGTDTPDLSFDEFPGLSTGVFVG